MLTNLLDGLSDELTGMVLEVEYLRQHVSPAVAELAGLREIVETLEAIALAAERAHSIAVLAEDLEEE